MIKFTREYPGFTVGKRYDAKYTMHPVWLVVSLMAIDDDNDVRYLAVNLVEEGTIEEVENDD